MNKTRQIAYMVRTDYCMCCQACQVACREINRVPFSEKWLEVTRAKPKEIDGKMKVQHSYKPVLEKCLNCVDQEEGPYCQAICSSKCLKVGDFEDLKHLLDDSPGRWSITLAALPVNDDN